MAAVARPAARVAEKKFIDIVDGAAAATVALLVLVPVAVPVLIPVAVTVATAGMALLVADACGADRFDIGVSAAAVAAAAVVAAARPRTSLLHS